MYSPSLPHHQQHLLLPPRSSLLHVGRGDARVALTNEIKSNIMLVCLCIRMYIVCLL